MTQVRLFSPVILEGLTYESHAAVTGGESEMTLLLLPSLVLAAVGLVLSLVAHGCALLGLPQPLGAATMGLHVGIFAVWPPAIIVSSRMAWGRKPKDFWQDVVRRRCPRWMWRMTDGLFVYAIVNFLIVVATGEFKKQLAGAPIPPGVFRGLSGHWMCFYSMALAILYSRLAASPRDEDQPLGAKPVEGGRDEVPAPAAMWDRELDG